MDCCRIPLSLNPHYPSYINAINVDILEAVGSAPPPGFQRVRLGDLRKEDD